jgi:membrane protease YdiL (CAAX protease family)
VTLVFLLVIWPALSIGFIGDPSETLKQLAVSPVLLVYVPTIITQWLLFLLVYLTTIREKSGLKGIGFKRIRGIDFLWALAFLLVSNLILSAISVALGWVGIKIPGELGLILPNTPTERVFWAILSLTAAVCEETAFRGYLLTRLKIFTRSRGWIIPVLIASLAFGTGHTYQGVGGFVLISIYGMMFCLLFIRTGSLWPVVIAHFFQDFSALFWPYPG